MKKQTNKQQKQATHPQPAGLFELLHVRAHLEGKADELGWPLVDNVDEGLRLQAPRVDAVLITVDDNHSKVAQDGLHDDHLAPLPPAACACACGCAFVSTHADARARECHMRLRTTSMIAT